MARIVVLCGGRAVSHAAPDSHDRDDRPDNNFLLLNRAFNYRFWVSKNDGAVAKRLYIECPALPAGPHSIDMQGAIHLCTLFKFIRAILGLNGIRPHVVESGSVLASILRLRSHQKLGYPAVTLQNLDLGIKTWLLRKGFNDDDMARLKQVAGDIVTGLIMLLHVLPWSPKRSSSVQEASKSTTKENIRWDGWERMDQARLAAVRELHHGITTHWRARLDKQRPITQAVPEKRLTPQAMSEKRLTPQAVSEKCLTSQAIPKKHLTPQTVSVKRLTPQAMSELQPTFLQEPTSSLHFSQNEDDLMNEEDMQRLMDGAQQIVDADTMLRSHDIRSGMNISNWVLERGKTHIYKYMLLGTLEWSTIKVCYVMIGWPKDLNLQGNEVVVRIEIAEGDHPHKYAEASEQVDPARHIAFKISGITKGGNVITFYPRTKTLKAVFRTNQLADRIIYGHNGRESAKKKRRFAYISAPAKGDLPPELQRFHNGGYSEDIEDLQREEELMMGS